jgi:hypothetical protein
MGGKALRRGRAQLSVVFRLGLVAGALLWAVPCAAQTPPSPAPLPSPNASPSASPSPAASPQGTPAPAPGTIRTAVDAHTTFIAQGTNGAGINPPEGPAFIAGSPAAPLTPYDTFSSGPMTPGNASESALYLTPTFGAKSYTMSVQFGVGYVFGSTTNASYWGESLFPTLNPHLGSQLVPYAIAFPQGAGEDDGHGFVGSVLAGDVTTRDGNLRLRGGWFNLLQSDSFVFTQPAYTSSEPQLAVLPAESLGTGAPTADFWTLANPQYPLHGFDIDAKSGIASAEVTDATLPSLPGTSARLTMASLVFDHGEGTRLSAQVAHVTTGGALVPTTVLFAQGTLIDTPQGLLPSGSIGGQQQTILGVRGAFHVFRLFDGIIEYGHSTYDADHVSEPGTQHPGNYYHAGIAKTIGRSSAAFDVYANDPYYATAILPYGAPENVWAVAWSWPGQWLKSNYQLINNYPVNVNRQGYRVKYQLDGGPLDIHVSYANFGQIQPITIANANLTGFVDGFFLPQANDAATLGRQNQYAFWATWHARVADIVVDWTEDTIRRAALPGHGQDLVNYHTPQYTMYATRALTPSTLVSLGYAQYFMNGSFGQSYENVNFGQREGFIGGEFRESPHTSTLVTFRRSSFAGYTISPGDPPPDFTGHLFVLEQRLSF